MSLARRRRYNSRPPSAATARQDAGMPAMPSGTVRKGTVQTADIKGQHEPSEPVTGVSVTTGLFGDSAIPEIR
jgi:hypothetical protein